MQSQAWLSRFKNILKTSVRRVQADAASVRDLLLGNGLQHASSLTGDGGFDAYRLLGSPRLSNEALRQRYHRIVREIHPDRLQALGASMGMIRRAEFVLAEINQAYDVIARRRGLK